MVEFKDTGGKTWRLDFTIGSVKRVREVAKKDLLALNDGNPPLIATLPIDVIAMVDVLWAMVKPQADADKISDVEFGERMSGEAIGVACQLFWEGLERFFVEIGQSNEALKISKVRQGLAHAIKRANEKVAAVNPEAMIDQSLGVMSTSGQGSSESSQTG